MIGTRPIGIIPFFTALRPCINFGERLLQGVASESVLLVNKVGGVLVDIRLGWDLRDVRCGFFFFSTIAKYMIHPGRSHGFPPGKWWDWKI